MKPRTIIKKILVHLPISDRFFYNVRYRPGSDYCRFAAAYLDNALMFILKGALMNHLQRHYVAAYYRNALMSCCTEFGGGRLRQQSYYGKRIMSPEEGNEFLFESLSRGNPFAVARFGITELRPLVQYIGVELGIFKNINKVFGKYLCSSSGFFPNENRYLLKFGRVMQEAASQVDLLAVWHHPMEDYVAEQWLKQSYLMEHLGLEPYFFCHTRPWTKALKGRKVLVVHPFVDSIRKQYERNRDKLFANKDILPEFELHTIRAVQTVANTKCEFKDWFEALESMVEQASRIDYDIAIIGAGAYGFPLAARFKQQAKQAIHLGGATQILFGIKGHRWDNHPRVAKHYNEHWIYPLEKKPKKADVAGVGTYW